jgi:Domain of unknown function (DUF4276)
MRTLVFFLEEPSAREMLLGLLPKILPDDVTPRFIVFEGKQDLERQLEKRLRGWNLQESAFLVLRDQDSGPCEPIKERLVKICQDAGHPESIVRIACRELESWYFGDLAAVETALNLTKLVQHASKAKYRIPDGIVNPSVELAKLTDGVYQKVGGSRLIGPHLDLTRNTSRSFQVFVEGIRRLL